MLMRQWGPRAWAKGGKCTPTPKAATLDSWDWKGRAQSPGPRARAK